MSGAEKLTQRQITERCIGASIETLLRLANKLSFGQEVDDRLEVLLASIISAANGARAIMRLYADRPYSEAMHTLLRSLAELVINACYLQIASEEELNSYRLYDTIMLDKAQRLIRELRPNFLSGAPKQTLVAFREHAEQVKQQTRDTVSNNSWTKTALHDRAIALDDRYKFELFKFISRVIYSSGHSYTHWTFASLTQPVEFLRTGNHDDAATRSEAYLALFGTAQVLHIFSLFICVHKDPNEIASNELVQDLMETYDDSPSALG
jgi:hypothetical protein